MKFRTDNLGDKQVLYLEGDLAIEGANELRELLVRHLESSQHLALNLNGVETAHVACLQILCSAHRTFWGLGRVLTLEGPLPPQFKTVLEDTGFDRDRGCPLDGSHTCLFASGGKQ